MGKQGLFSDFFKASDDILGDNYVSNTKVTIKSGAFSPFNINTNAVRSGSGAISGDVAAKFKHSSGVNGSVKVDHKGNSKAEASYKFSNPDLKVTGTGAFGGDKGPSAKLSTEFKHDAFTATGAFDSAASAVSASVCTGFGDFAVGGDFKYDVGASKVKSYTGGFKYAPNDHLTLAGLYKSSGLCQAQYAHKFGDKVNLAAVVDHNRSTKANEATVGCELDYEKNEKLCAKASTTGIVNGSYQFKATDLCSVNLSVSVNSLNLGSGEGHGFGVSFSFEDN